MTSTSKPDFPLRPATFSEAQGLVPLPAQLALGEVSREFRALLWSAIYRYNERVRQPGRYLNSRWRAVLRDLHVEYLNQPADDFDDSEVIEHVKKPIFTFPYNSLFDLLQWLIRHPNFFPPLVEEIAPLFPYCRLAYRLDVTAQTIYPAATLEEGSAVSGALQALVGEPLGRVVNWVKRERRREG